MLGFACASCDLQPASMAVSGCASLKENNGFTLRGGASAIFLDPAPSLKTRYGGHRAPLERRMGVSLSLISSVLTLCKAV